MFDSVPSLVVSVADVFIAETPGGIVRWSIETFGATQKTVLVTGIVVGCLLAGCLLGLAGRRDPRRGIAGLVVFGLIGGWAASRDALTSDGWGWFSATVSTGVGIVALALLLRRSDAVTESADGPRGPETMGSVDRRRFLVTTGTVAFVGAASGEIGRRLRLSRVVETARQKVAARLAAGPQPSVKAPVNTFDNDVPGISPLVTPNDDFYRIDTRDLPSPGRSCGVVTPNHRHGRP